MSKNQNVRHNRVQRCYASVTKIIKKDAGAYHELSFAGDVISLLVLGIVTQGQTCTVEQALENARKFHETLDATIREIGSGKPITVRM